VSGSGWLPAGHWGVQTTVDLHPETTARTTPRRTSMHLPLARQTCVPLQLPGMAHFVSGGRRATSSKVYPIPSTVYLGDIVAPQSFP
jgi:hypothetical protein